MSRIRNAKELKYILDLRKKLDNKLWDSKNVMFSEKKENIDFLEKNIDYIHKDNDKVKRIYGVTRNELVVRKIIDKNIYIICVKNRMGYRRLLIRQSLSVIDWILFPFARFLQCFRTFTRNLSEADGFAPTPFMEDGFYPEIKDRNKKYKLWETYYNKFDYYILVKDSKTNYRIKKIDNKEYPSIKLTMLNEWAYIPSKLKWSLTLHNSIVREQKWEIEIRELKKEIKAFEEDKKSEFKK